MKSYNLNSNVILYPNKSGWEKIAEITQEEYALTKEQAGRWVNNRKQGAGFKEQLWVIMSVYHKMFFNGQRYFETTFIDLVEESTV